MRQENVLLPGASAGSGSGSFSILFWFCGRNAFIQAKLSKSKGIAMEGVGVGVEMETIRSASNLFQTPIFSSFRIQMCASDGSQMVPTSQI